MSKSLSAVIYFLAVMILLLPPAHSDERVGTFQIEELLLRPTLLSIEEDGGEFSLTDSAFSLSWTRDERLSAHMTIGSELTRNIPVYYGVVPEDKLAFTEAFAQYENVYGRFRFGLVPLHFGYDGVVKSSERYYKRAMPHTKRVIGLRDYGMNFYTSHRGYFTQLTVHNGEVDAASDGRLWTSANWGYTNDRNWRVQLSLQTGYVDGEVAGDADGIGGVVVDRTQHWRNGLFFVNWYPRNWNVVLQAGGGEVDQDDEMGRYSSAMVEVTRYFSKNFAAGLRLDEFDPNRNLNGDKTTESSLLLLFKSADSTSDFYLLGTKVIEESNEQPNDELRLVWLLTPYSR